MRRPTGLFAGIFAGTLAALALVLLAVPALAHDHEEAKAAASSAGVRGEILFFVDDAEKKLTALAEATPAEKFAWRPAEKVRSVGEVFMHVAGGNYYLATFWGVKPPEGLNAQEFEASGGDKTKVIATMKASFEHVRKAIQDAPDADFDKAIKMFGHDATVRAAMLAVASHAHEHLGQSIAYARKNAVTPPWSGAGN